MSSDPLTVLCPECGELMEVKDPAALIQALHLANACELRVLFNKAEQS